MLAPFEERRVDPEVFEYPPDLDSAGVLQKNEARLAASEQSQDIPTSLFMKNRGRPGLSPPQDGADGVVYAVPSSCIARIGAGFPQNSGDRYLDNVMFWRAWLGIESVTGLRSRYDREVNFQDNTWDEGLGWNDFENDNKPFKRALNSFFLIENATNDTNPPGDYSRGIINYAWDYIKRETPEFEGSCQDSNIAATTYTCSWFGWWCDERIELKMALWDQSPPVRAGLIVHESRHAAGYAHNGGSGCLAGGSCDYQYSDGRANTWEVQWLAQYYRVGQYNTSRMRVEARKRANAVLSRFFTVCPNVQLGGNGYFYSVQNGCHQ